MRTTIWCSQNVTMWFSGAHFITACTVSPTRHSTWSIKQLTAHLLTFLCLLYSIQRIKNCRSCRLQHSLLSHFLSSVISNQSTCVLYELMCWLSVVVRSPPARRPLSWIQSLLIYLWILVTEVSTLSLDLLTTQTMVTTGILPLQGKISMV